MFLSINPQPVTGSFDSALLANLGGERRIGRTEAGNGNNQQKQQPQNPEQQTGLQHLVGTAQSVSAQPIARAADTVTFIGAVPNATTYSHLARCPAVMRALSERMRQIAA